jgi:hypothetical protein
MECGHAGPPGNASLCAHLLDGARPAAGFVGLLTGDGLGYDRSCHDCADRPVLVPACAACTAAFDGTWPRTWRGRPGIAERPEPLTTTLIRTPLPHEFGTIADAAPAGDGWLLLTADGRLARLDPEGPARALATVKVRATPGAAGWDGQKPRLRLLISADGRYAAVVRDFDRFGKVVDLTTGKVTLDLNGGDYLPGTVPFSAAFTPPLPGFHPTPAAGTVTGTAAAGWPSGALIHRTAWNRLDAADPADGRPLTARRTAEDHHDLDYFHGALHVSPGGRWVADDGWVWHPFGIPHVWDLRRWLGENPWESEDGPSLRELCARGYHWNVPMAWLGDDLLAVGGIGDNDAAMLPGARLFDPATGEEVRAFAGPEGAFFGYAGRLYSAHPDGLDVWDPATGERTGRVPGFVPTHLHPARGELAALTPRHLVRWQITQHP